MRNWKSHKLLFGILGVLLSFNAFSQEEDSAELQEEMIRTTAKANNYVYEGNEKLSENDFIEAEAEYRKAISTDVSNAKAPYNLGNAYYRNEKLSEAFDRYKQSAGKATNKDEKHKAFHNLGNVFMKNEEYEKAVEAFKSALRNNPNDEETRYNYALAKELLKKENEGGGGDDDQDQNQDQQNKDQNKEGDNEDEKGENQDQENQDQNNKEGENDQQQEGENEQDKQGDEQEDKKDEDQGGDQPKDQEQKQQPRPSQLSPQQVKNLLEAANNEENKVQDKINLKKAKGAKIKTDKDW